jgi:hypothetical protein
MSQTIASNVEHGCVWNRTLEVGPKHYLVSLLSTELGGAPKFGDPHGVSQEADIVGATPGRTYEQCQAHAPDSTQDIEKLRSPFPEDSQVHIGVGGPAICGFEANQVFDSQEQDHDRGSFRRNDRTRIQQESVQLVIRNTNYATGDAMLRERLNKGLLEGGRIKARC